MVRENMMVKKVSAMSKHKEGRKMKQKTKKQKVAEDKKVLVESSPSPKEGIVMHAGASRNELMIAAKERGVKNFRVLNKQELADVLKNIGDRKAVDAIVAGAVDRWKSGWGKRRDKNESQC